MTTRLPLMAGNWKMHLNHFEAVAHVQRIVYGLKDEDYLKCEVLVCAPFTDLRSLQVLKDADKLKISIGSQDISMHDKGAYTGEISGGMLAKLEVQYAIVGHSERREYHVEDNEDVNAKAKAALRHGIVPIVCFGEPIEVRERGDQVIFCLDQVAQCLADLSDEEVSGLVLAYEPRWAIGTGLTASPTDAQEVIGAVRSWVADKHGSVIADKVRILYGGSMKAANVAALMSQPDIDGGLIGGAALDPDEFVTMVRYRLLPV